MQNQPHPIPGINDLLLMPPPWYRAHVGPCVTLDKIARYTVRVRLNALLAELIRYRRRQDRILNAIYRAKQVDDDAARTDAFHDIVTRSRALVQTSCQKVQMRLERYMNLTRVDGQAGHLAPALAALAYEFDHPPVRAWEDKLIWHVSSALRYAERLLATDTTNEKRRQFFIALLARTTAESADAFNEGTELVCAIDESIEPPPDDLAAMQDQNPNNSPHRGGAPEPS